MKYRMIMLAALLLGVASAGAFGKVLLTAEYRGHRYHLLDQKEWSEQNREAKASGWYLVSIGDQDENAFIRATFAGPRGNVWIGLTDAAKEGEFKWVNGEAVTYTFWAPNEPNNDQGAGNYVHMYETGHWNDERDFRKFYAVAEEDPAQEQPVTLAKWLWLLAVVPVAVVLAMLQRARAARRRQDAVRRR